MQCLQKVFDPHTKFFMFCCAALNHSGNDLDLLLLVSDTYLTGDTK